MSLRRYSPFLAITSVFAACGGQPTQFSSPETYRVAFSMSGTGVDRVEQLKQLAEQEGVDEVVIESGMSEQEKAANESAINQALEDAIAAASASTSSGSNPDASSGSSSGSGSSGSSGTTSTPFQVKPVKSLGQVAGNLGKFKAACAEVMSVSSSKVIGPMVSGSVARDEVLLVIVDKNGSLNIPLQGDAMRGICIMSGQGGVVNIEGGNTKVGGVLSYQQGANNKALIKFASGGKLDSAVATFSGSKNEVVFESAKLASCNAPSVYRIGAGEAICK